MDYCYYRMYGTGKFPVDKSKELCSLKVKFSLLEMTSFGIF